MNLRYVTCSVHGMSVEPAVTSLCPICGAEARTTDFAPVVSQLGNEAVESILTPDAIAKFNELANFARQITFKDLSWLLDYYTQPNENLNAAPPTIKKFVLAMKSDNAMAITAHLSLLISILAAAGIFTPSQITPQEVIEIVREYDAEHTPQVPMGTDIEVEISPKLIDPPKNIDT